ncbi:MAG: LysR family transcriptional regulator [Candidatus Binatia bacterium]|jgi:DNA-binding transcriptional LysR family regulator|nr:LysR family transcriptional regulator [Candidatus Binatia bacterium]MDG1959557.1 LysR family transcriptional regulator [Candidatus Binatia bacterium]MDG2010382.1 LysR family transcriptional regulator [Candidatus Binatia bacterium]
MHIETLKVFCDLVDTGSFSVAAAQNYVTQSAVSQQIRTLETRYGRKLVERAKRRVRPTPAGEIFYEISREIVARHQDLEARLQAFSNIVAGTVRVATVHSVGLYEFSDELKRYVKAYPSVNVRLEYKKSSQIYEDVLAGTLDVGVIAYPHKRPQIRLIPFREDQLVMICDPTHALARHKTISVKKLEGQNFVGFEKDIPTHKAIDKVLQKHQVRVNYVAEVDNIEVIKRIVEVGTGISIAPAPAVGPEIRSQSLVAIPFSDEHFVRQLGIIHKEGRHFSPAAEKFIDTLTPGQI